MALRANSSSTSTSSIAGLPFFWQEATKTPELEWEKWRDLFEVALMAKSNISVAELIKTTGTQEKSLMGDMEEATAMKKANSVLYLALGMAARNSRQIRFQTNSRQQISLQSL